MDIASDHALGEHVPSVSSVPWKQELELPPFNPETKLCVEDDKDILHGLDWHMS